MLEVEELKEECLCGYSYASVWEDFLEDAIFTRRCVTGECEGVSDPLPNKSIFN